MLNRRTLLTGTAGAAAVLIGAQRFTQGSAMAAPEIVKTDAEWRKQLSPQQYAILRKHDTERPGSSPLNHEKRKGTFACAGCDLPLFSSDTKFESGTGWPSFNDPVPGSVETTTDRSYGMVRTEVHCATCGSHLGHVFPDGPPDRGGLRYCINSASLDLKKA